MSNQLINPLIHPHNIDTLSHCSDCLELEYLIESFNTLVLEETSKPAQQGFTTFLMCISQALDFETDRADHEGSLHRFRQPVDGLEKKLLRQICQQILADEEEDKDDIIAVPDPKSRGDH